MVSGYPSVNEEVLSEFFFIFSKEARKNCAVGHVMIMPNENVQVCGRVRIRL